nr:hypothetical protein [Angustibacter aerolatus]
MSSRYADLSRPPLDERALRRALLDDRTWTSVDVLPEVGSTNVEPAPPRGRGPRRRRRRAHHRPPARRPRTPRPQAADPAPRLHRRLGAARPHRAARPLVVAPAARRRRRHRHPRARRRPRRPPEVAQRRARPPRGPALAVRQGRRPARRGRPPARRHQRRRRRHRPQRQPARRRAPSTPPSPSPAPAPGSTDRDPLLRALLRDLATRYERWDDAAGDPRASGLAAAYRERCATLGLDVAVDLPGGDRLEGVAQEVDDDGRLVVAPALGGAPVPLAAGDVVHVRPS